MPYYRLIKDGDTQEANVLKAIGALILRAKQLVRQFKQEIQLAKRAGSQIPPEAYAAKDASLLASLKTILQQWPDKSAQDALFKKLALPYKQYIEFVHNKLESLQKTGVIPGKSLKVEEFLEPLKPKK